MKEVAIVGFYGPTLDAVKTTTAQEIWVPNHGYMVMQDDLPGCTRLFEIHPQDWFRRKELPVHEKYWEWLKEIHPFPIYLQENIPEIINGVVYPYKEVCDDLFPHLLRQDKSGELIRDTFLTCSASFMLALAIHEKFDRVWIYGIGMEVDTEYYYQLPGFTYLIGLANGRGIDVINQYNSPICNAHVYAYETIPQISQKRLLELRESYYKKLMRQNDIANALITDLNSGKSKDQNAAYQASDLLHAWQGAIAMIDTLLKQDSRYMSRQALEVKRRPYAQQTDSYKADVNALTGKYFALTKQQQRKDGPVLWQEYMNKRASMHANAGAVQLLDNLIEECDLLKTKHEIVLNIKDVEP